MTFNNISSVNSGAADIDVITACIERAAWFEHLSMEAKQNLAKQSVVMQFGANEKIYGNNIARKNLFCVVSGRVRVSVTSNDGQQFSLVDFHDDFWFGESSLISDKPNAVEAFAVEASSVMRVPVAAVLNEADKNPLFYKSLFTDVMKRTSMLYNVLTGVLFYPLKARIASRLLNLLEQYGDECEEGVLLDIQLSQQDFADMCMGSRQHVNKVFREWANADVLIKRKGRYIIRNVEQLEQQLEAKNF